MINLLFEMFRPNVAVVRFKNKKSFLDGFVAVFDNGDAVVTIDEFTLGLTSKRQLKLLNAAKVPYERIK